MREISFMGANLVAEQLNWNMTEGWMQGDGAANAYYSPIETFPARFEKFIDYAVALEFAAIDVWTGQLNWAWATDAHLSAASEILKRRNIKVLSYAGAFGNTLQEFEAATRVAQALNTGILGGNAAILASDRPAVIKLLKSKNIVLALENHPEKSSNELLQKIGTDGEGHIGAAIDTGWWATQGFDAAQSIVDLKDHLSHIHLKDIRAAGAHETCAFGEGIVDIKKCVGALKEVGYTGPISIEHEPEHFNPAVDVRLSKQRLAEWLA